MMTEQTYFDTAWSRILAGSRDGDQALNSQIDQACTRQRQVLQSAQRGTQEITAELTAAKNELAQFNRTTVITSPVKWAEAKRGIEDRIAFIEQRLRAAQDTLATAQGEYSQARRQSRDALLASVKRQWSEASQQVFAQRQKLAAELAQVEAAGHERIDALEREIRALESMPL